MLARGAFDAKASSHNDYDVILEPVFEKQGNVHASDAASSNSVETSAEVGKVLVCKPAAGEGPES